MNARRGFLRALAVLPAALRPTAETIATATPTSLGAGVYPSADAPISATVGYPSATVSPPGFAAARRALALFERKVNAKARYQLAGIDPDLWAIRSYSHTYRAMRQEQRREEFDAATFPHRKILGWLFTHEE